MDSYDYIIVGAGIAGLHTAIQIKKKHPKASVVVLERYNYNGGRVVTYKHTVPGYGKVQWENGAGRIHKEHQMVMKYMRRYGLTFSPIDDGVGFCDKQSGKQSDGAIRPNLFETTYIPIIRGLLENLSEDELAGDTIDGLLGKILGLKKDSLLGEFAYNSEVDTLRADVGLGTFRGEMGSGAGFGVCVEGLSALIDGMVGDFERLGGVILMKHRVLDVNGLSLSVSVGKKEERVEKTLVAKKAVVLALHFDALCEIPSIRGWKMLSRVVMRPLMRMYAVFKKGLGVSRFVTDSGIRYFIPIGEKVAMISYTDGESAEKFMKILNLEGEVTLLRIVMSDLRKCLPGIPDPIFFKTHAWKSGCTYWLPGDYDVAASSVEAHTPFPGKPVYICGESFSLRQAWMEGALEHAESLLKNVDL